LQNDIYDELCRRRGGVSPQRSFPARVGVPIRS
jgi:hypothetical protein